MNQDVVLWMIGQGIAMAGVLASCYVAMLNRFSVITERIRALEVCLELMGRTASKVLHSPHDPWGIDAMLDKYLDRHYEMTLEEWAQLEKICEKLEDDTQTTTRDMRLAFGMLKAVCWHKQFKNPPPRPLKK